MAEIYTDPASPRTVILILQLDVAPHTNLLYTRVHAHTHIAHELGNIPCVIHAEGDLLLLRLVL